MPDENPTIEHRPIRSFAIRSGRMTDAQRQSLDKNKAQWALTLGKQKVTSKAIFNNEHPLTVEIGFGMGDSLVEMALASPTTNFIGIEVHQAGVGRLLRLVEKNQLSNVRIYCDDAVQVFTQDIGDNVIDRINIYFPDPWHKTKHRKRRLIQESFLTLISPRLKPGGLLHVATDWQPYAKHVLNTLQGNASFENIADSALYVDPQDYGRPETKFERRGVKLGHGVWDMVFKNV